MRADKFIKRIFHPRYHVVWTCTVGVNQSGKTDMNLFIMERLHALGLASGFGSNVPVEAEFEVDFIEDFQTLRNRCQMLNPNPSRYGLKRYFFFASEMGKWAAQDIPWKNTNLIRELQLVRKYGLSVLGDGIDRIDRRIFSPSHFHGFFEKHSKEKPQKAVYIDWTKKGKKTKIDNIPQTKIKYDTFHSARFFMEPELPENLIIPLNYEHEVVKKYRDLGSWAKAGVHRQEGKRCLFKVIDYHFTHCLKDLPQEEPEPVPVKAEIA
ncbi:MAG: hypothetical protein ACW99G_21705 [Candidatus Thorarchaeota archaeon]|jgi:hypothetical protein